MRKPLFAGALAIAITLVPVMLPAAAQTAPGGKIVFAQRSGGSDATDIWIMNGDGTEPTNLTKTPDVAESDPQLSPDGTRIAFTMNLPDPAEQGSWYSEIMVMDVDGSNRTSVTDTSSVGELYPSWAPDSVHLAFAAEIPGRVMSTQSDIFTINVNGADRTQVTSGDYEEIQPAWSPLGDRIAVTAVRNGDWEIITVNPDGSGEKNLTNNGGEDPSSRQDWAPDWSPDGTKLVFMAQLDNPCCGDWEIWAMNADGSGQTNLTDNPAGDDFPSWSPDGTQIVFQSNRSTGWETDLWVMPAPTTLGAGTAVAIAPSVESSVAGSLFMGRAEAAVTATRLTSGSDTSAPDWGIAAEAGGGGTTCTITGTAGADILSGTSGADVICGRGGNDKLSGLAGNDTLLGGGGNDTLVPGGGTNSLTGGLGSDTASYSSSGKAVVADLAAGTVSGPSSDTLAETENLTGSRYADRLGGNGIANVLLAGGGNDTLSGAGGADVLKGGDGSDSLNGGLGTDTCLGGAGTNSLTGCER